MTLPMNVDECRRILELPSSNGQPRARVDLMHTRFMVTAWPNNRLPLELYQWIRSKTAGHPLEDNVVTLVKKDRTCARNTMVRKALDSNPHYEWFVFVDADVRPGVHTDAFLEVDADVVSCQVPMQSKLAWCSPDAFHEALWCTSRRVLTALDPPWFWQPYNDDHTEMTGCMCRTFREKALGAGFSIAHGGYADHDQDGSWHN